jgi:dolichol-phosphate mannosyltransferase
VDTAANRARESVDPAPDLHVVVPVYNEADNFRPFYESLQRHVRTPYRVVVVYDFEEDTTLPVVRELQKSNPNIALVRNPVRGVLSAMKTGLKWPPGGAVLVSMADLSDDHSAIDSMYALYKQGYDVVAPSRYMRGGGENSKDRLKASLSRLAGVSLRWVGGVPTHDATNNFKLYSKRLIDAVEIESTGGFEVALELTVKAHLKGFKIAELPTTWTDRVAGKSNFKLMKWLPSYLRWYGQAMKGRVLRPFG